MRKRTNEERLGMPTPGAKHSSDAPPVSMAPADEPSIGLSYVIPTGMVAIPSQGKLYPETHPLYGMEEVELKEMTAKEEDILTTQSYIKKGTAFDRLLRSLIVDKSIKPGELLIGDKNALLIGARISAYGNLYDTTVSCPICSHEQSYEFDLLTCPHTNPVDLQTTEDEELRQAVSEGDEAGKYLILLPKSQCTVEIRLVTGNDETSMTQLKEMKRKKKLAESPLTDHLKKIVLSVNGVDQSGEVSRFIESMPASDSRFLRKMFAKLTPNIEMTQEFVCDECDYEQELEVPFTSRFFWPDS